MAGQGRGGSAPTPPPRGRDSPWIPIILRAFLRAENGVGSSLCRLPDSCHAESLIPAGRFFRKEKSSLLRAGYSLRRTGIPGVAQCCSLQKVPSAAEHVRSSLRRNLCAACWNEFFLYEKMGRRAIDHAGNISEVGGRAQAPVPTPSPQKTGIQGDSSPWRSSRQSLEVFPAGKPKGKGS